MECMCIFYETDQIKLDLFSLYRELSWSDDIHKTWFIAFQEHSSSFFDFLFDDE